MKDFLQNLKISINVFLTETILFSLAMILGIFSGLKLMKIRQILKEPPAQPVSPLDFLTAFFIATLFILLIPLVFRKRKFKAGVFKAIFVFIAFLGGTLALAFWLPDYLALGIMIFLILAWLKFPLPLLHNLIIILTIVGLSVVLGLSLEPLMVIAFLALFSIYDFIAVYKTKHMVKIAKEMIFSGVVLGFIASNKFSDLISSLKKLEPGGKFFILGAGDIVFPLLLVVSLIPQGIGPALITGFFALFGFLFSFLIFATQEKRAPIPALPPIAFFSILGYLFSKLFFG
jgi:presenilin-like A22 family membrane protease